jgi:ligand-binding sensor domain-containing protein
MNTPDEGWVLNDHDTWLTGSAGPRRYDGKTLYQLKLPKSPEADEWYAKYPNVPTKPYDVWTVYKDRKGRMWFGTACLGICRFDGKTREWMYEDHLTNTPEGGLFGIRSIIEDKDGAFWFCNTKYRFRMTRPPAPAGETAQESSGEIAYAREQGVDPALLPPGESPIYFQGIVDDQAGDLWMATYGFGVWRYDGQKMTHHLIKDGENVVTLFSIYKDNHGGLWLASHEHGAYKFDGKSFEKFKP